MQRRRISSPTPTAHCKFIAVGADAKPLFDQARVPPELDDGVVPLASAKDAKRFVESCRSLRYWPREPAVDLDAASQRKR
jgi:catalase